MAGDAKPAAEAGDDGEDEQAARLKKEQETKFADSLGKKHAKRLMIAAGFRPGPNVSLQHAIDTFKADQTRSLILYVVFLFCFTVSSYTQRDVQDAHFYVNSVKSVILGKPFTVVPYFKSFNNISRPDDVWLYFETVLPDYLFEEKWYNGDPIEPENLNSILQSNRLVQAPRVRQLRVQSYKCADGPGGLTNVFNAVPARLKQYLVNCYPGVDGAEWETDEVLAGWPPGNIIHYRSGPELSTEYYSSQYEVYEGGGWAIDIPLNSTQAEVRAMFTYLREQKWTDKKTRAIFVDFATYQPYEGFYLSVRLNFEFLPIGEIVPTSSFRVMRLGFTDPKLYASLAFDGLVYLILCRFIYEDAVRFQKMPKYWLRSAWNHLSLCIYFVFGITLIFKIRFFWRSIPYVNAPPSPTDSMVAAFDFESLGWISSQIWNWTALNSVLIWMRAFRFVKYANDAIAGLAYAIFDSANPLLTFFFLFGLLNFAYGVSFHIAFGVDVGGHVRGVTGGLGTLPSAVFGQWRMLLKGGNDFSEIVAANRLLGPLLLLSYQFVGVIIGTKVPAAILNKTYSIISDHGSDDPMAKEFRSVLIRNAKRLIFKLFYYGKKDEDELFRLEREAQHEQVFHTKAKRRRRKGDKEKEDIEKCNKNFYAIEKIVKEFQRTVTVISGRIEQFSEVELKKQAAFEAKHIEPAPTLLFGRREAWGQPGSYSSDADLSSCIKLMGNKTILPPNWKLYHSEEGDPFYYNISAETVQWDPPVVMMAGIVPEVDEDDDDVTPTKKPKKKKKRDSSI